MRRFVLKNICDCSVAQQEQILDLRNSDTIRREMYTDRIITRDEHFNYIEQLRIDRSRVVFCVLAENSDAVGILSISQIDRTHKKCDWAFYLAGNVRGGVGSALEFFLIDFVFNIGGMKKLNCEVIETNEAVVAMHKKFGFIQEGLRRYNIVKDGNRIGVYFLGLTDLDWRRIRDDIVSRIGEKLSDIDISFYKEPSQFEVVRN